MGWYSARLRAIKIKQLVYNSLLYNAIQVFRYG